jgi:uncharacterized protein YidB (DUF937 family)
MDLLQIGSQLLAKQLGGDVSEEKAGNALSGLLGDGSGGLDIAGLVGKFASSAALGNIVGSWLGDGGNKSIDPSQLLEMFGGDKLSAFAASLGLNQETATNGLSEVLPSLIDKSSSGGDLLESVGGLGGALNMAKKFF